jgi:hypothetical protein
MALCAPWLLIGCGGGASESTSAVSSLGTDTYTCTRYVDAATGADTNSGLSPEDAWASADRAAAHTRSAQARAGDTLCFKRGQRFVVLSGQLGSRGTAAAPVTLGAYGDPSVAAPRLSPALRIDNTPDWVNLGNGVYLWPNSHPQWNTNALWRGGVWQRLATTSALQDGEWYYEKGVGVYVRLPSTPATAGAIYLAVKYAIFGVHRLQYIAFRDLHLEYGGAAISGRPFITGELPRVIAYLSIRNCRFDHLAKAVVLFSETVDGRVYENHHIDITGNRFDDIRYAINLGSPGNGSQRHRFVTIVNNTIRRVAVNGSYAVNDGIQDIEAISLQNPTDTLIADNRIETGLRREQGIVNIDGDLLFSNGIVVYRHPTTVIDRLRIERNYVRDLDYGIAVGSGMENAMREVTVANNIVSRCTVGLQLNGTSTLRTYHVRFNTLFQNGVNLYLASAGGQVVVNNFSVGPGEYHVVVAGTGSDMDYNTYVPDGRFLLSNTSGLMEDRLFPDLRTFQTEWIYDRMYDTHSHAASGAGFVKSLQQTPEDFRLTELSPARGQGVANGEEDGDFGRRARPTGSGIDIGAWARYPSDG